VTETWYKESSDAVINGYELYRSDRKGHGGGGGVCIYVKNYLNSSVTNIAVLNSNTIEQIWVNLRTPKESILLGCIYRPPTTSIEENDAIVRSLEKTNELVQNKKFSSLIVTGDFNHRNIEWADGMWTLRKPNAQADRFLNCMDDAFLTQCSNRPTYDKADGTSENTLDLLIVDENHRISEIEHGPLG
jgi:hypothetical protein